MAEGGRERERLVAREEEWRLVSLTARPSKQDCNEAPGLALAVEAGRLWPTRWFSRGATRTRARPSPPSGRTAAAPER